MSFRCQVFSREIVISIYVRKASEHIAVTKNKDRFFPDIIIPSFEI